MAKESLMRKKYEKNTEKCTHKIFLSGEILGLKPS